MGRSGVGWGLVVNRYLNTARSGDRAHLRPTGYQFAGHYRHAIDAKGRVSIPAKLRQHAKDRAEIGGRQEAYFIVKGPDGSLVLLPEDSWERLNQALFARGPNDPRMRFLRRQTQSMSFPATPDKQGRIAIPAPLADEAGLRKEALFLGLGPYIEIWEPDRYEQYQREKEDTYSWEEMWLRMYGVLADESESETAAEDRQGNARPGDDDAGGGSPGPGGRGALG